MTYKMLYRHILNLLSKAGIDSPAFDTLCMFEDVCNMNRHNLIMYGEKVINEIDYNKLICMAKKRAEGYPLQYILGIWEFMGFEFFVGEGVLIPREDTSVVVELCLDKINSDKVDILDLCAGSGTISVALSRLIKNSNVTAFELSEKAISYLEKNIKHNDCNNIKIVKGDIFKDYDDFPNNTFDVIISNPPYIISDEINTLQKEVQFEPHMALDGGEDGYKFYREIISNWNNCLKSGGLIVFEIGENQFDIVSQLMIENNFKDIDFAYDIQNIKRGVCGVKI